MEELPNISIQICEQYGRYLVAGKDFKQGDVILREKALVVGPKLRGDLICLNCYNVFFKKFHICTKCKLAPLCGPLCEDHRGGHSEAECTIFSSIRSKFTVPQLLNSYHLVTVVRCLALRQLEDQKSWNDLVQLEHHIDKRKGTGIWNFHEGTRQVIECLGLAHKNDSANNMVQKICARIDINSFELRTPLNGRGESNTDSLCGIYSSAAMMAHNCISNTHLSVDDSYTMTIRAAVAIQKGNLIYFNYTNALSGTVERREHLREGKYCECFCERCIDATELKTHMSSINCLDCSSGLVCMVKPQNSTQYSAQDKWRCQNCDKEYSGSKVKEVIDQVSAMIPNEDDDIAQYQQFLQESSKYLPCTHSVMIDVKHKLAGLLRDLTHVSVTVPKKLVKVKLEICKELLTILDIIEPGISRLKAITLYEIFNPLVMISNMEYDAKEISSAEFLARLEEAERYLKESIKFLLLEPVSSPEATLCRRAMLELRNHKSNVDAIKILVEEEQFAQKLRQITFN